LPSGINVNYTFKSTAPTLKSSNLKNQQFQ